MTDTSDYRFEGYYDDDARMIHDILEHEWNEDVLKDKILLYYNETTDISSVNYNTGELAIKIYADDISSTPMGIGFDSIEQDRTMNLEIKTIDRDLYIGAIDEIRRILTKYRLRPGNAWDTMWVEKVAPVYPTEKFYHTKITIKLKQYCHVLPLAREGWPDGGAVWRRSLNDYKH